MERILITAAALLGPTLALTALVTMVWALVVKGKRSAARLSLCLWVAIASGTATSALWSWMTTADWEYQRRKIANLPAGAAAKDVDLNPTAMLLFYVMLDRLLRRLLYLPVALPLLLSLVLYWKTRQPRKTAMPIDDLWSPEL